MAGAAKPGPRVVAHSPAVGVIIRDLDAESLVVGRHGHDMVLDKSLPVIGTQEGFAYEALLAAEPTHIITQWGSRDLPVRLVELSKSQGWKLLDTRLLSLDDIRRDALAVDAFLCQARNDAPPSAAGTALIARMDKAWSKHGEGFADLGRVLLLASTTPPAAFGPGSCHHELLARIGATPAIIKGNAYIELDAEAILKIAPDVIVLVSPRGQGTRPLTTDEQARRLTEKFATIWNLQTPAAKNMAYSVVDDPLSLLPSTSMIAFAEALAASLERTRARIEKDRRREPSGRF
jgi:ABC-type hemin transport system substrate-binding protein